MTRPIGNQNGDLLARLVADSYGRKPAANASGSPLDGLADKLFQDSYARLVGATEAESKPSAASGEGSSLLEAIKRVDATGLEAGEYAEGLISGEVSSLNELVVRAKRAELTLNYTLAIRDRLVDAYREVMRMSV